MNHNPSYDTEVEMSLWIRAATLIEQSQTDSAHWDSIRKLDRARSRSQAQGQLVQPSSSTRTHRQVVGYDLAQLCRMLSGDNDQYKRGVVG